MSLVLMATLITACGGSSEETSAETSTSTESNLEPDPGDFESRVPNNGQFVHIVSPDTGAQIPFGQQVILEIETDNFDMMEEGNHWHVYVDGQNWGMVTGGNMDQPLTGLSAGEHTIHVYLSIDTHEELEEGDSIVISVTE